MRGDAKDGIPCIVSERTVFVHAISFTRDVWVMEILGSLLRPTLGVCMSSWLGRQTFRMQDHWPVRGRPCVLVATPRVLVFRKVDGVEPRMFSLRRVGKVRPSTIHRPLSMRTHRRSHERAFPSPLFRERFPFHPPTIRVHMLPLGGPSSPSWGLRDTARVVDGETSVEDTLDGRFFSTGEETPSYPVGPRLPPAQRWHGGSFDSHACVSARTSTLRGALKRPPFPVRS